MSNYVFKNHMHGIAETYDHFDCIVGHYARRFVNIEVLESIRNRGDLQKYCVAFNSCNSSTGPEQSRHYDRKYAALSLLLVFRRMRAANSHFSTLVVLSRYYSVAPKMYPAASAEGTFEET